jgi:predicted nucleotide-binding protein
MGEGTMVSHRDKPRAFIGCSKEGIDSAYALQMELKEWCYPLVWSQGIFELSKTIIEGLETKLQANYSSGS